MDRRKRLIFHEAKRLNGLEYPLKVPNMVVVMPRTYIPKAKVTVSVDVELISWADYEVIDGKYPNRSAVFNKALKKLKEDKP